MKNGFQSVNLENKNFQIKPQLKMEFSQELIVSTVGLIATITVGSILYRQIISQNEIINNMKINMDSMKAYMDLFDIEKVKSYTNLSVEEAELRYKREYTNKLADVIKQTNKISKEGAKEAAEKFIKDNGEFFEKYEEILNMHINFLLPMKREEREVYLANFPKNREVLLSFLDAIDSGEVKPK